jgi:FlgD Ig-like domain
VRRVAVTVLVLGLLGGTAAAFTITEALKLERAPIRAPRFDKVFSPTCDCPTRVATLSFRIRSADRLDLVIVSGQEPVRTLALDLDRPEGRVTVQWDGRDDSGGIVPDGRYRLRIHLEDAERTIVVPKEIRVDTEPPTLELVRVAPLAFSPDGDGRADKVRIVYRTSEDAAPVIVVDGRIGAETRMKRKGERAVAWNGRVDGGLVGVGRHTLFLRVRDEAGNVTQTARGLAVDLRYVEILPRRIVASRGARLRFRVETDVPSFSWNLRRPHGGSVLADSKARPGRVGARLPSAIAPGRYILVVTAAGHRDRVIVRIVKRRA